MYFPAAYEEEHITVVGYWIFSEGIVFHEECIKEQIFPDITAAHGRAHTRAQEKCEEEGVTERNCYGLTTGPHSIYEIFHPIFISPIEVLSEHLGG